MFVERQESDMRSVHYLHGALHLTTHGEEVRKLEWEDNTPIMDSVRDNLGRGHYPLFVSEGESSDKLRRINSSHYLYWNFQRFREIEGHLFTYGSALADQDKHLWDAVARNDELKSLYVGIYGDPEIDENRRLVATAEGLSTSRQGQPLNVSFYKSESASVWSCT